MSSYRSAYENYYKNINSSPNGKKDKNNYFNTGKKSSNIFGLKYNFNEKNNDSFTNILIKRVIRELTGATILLFFFVGLKYIPSDQVRDMHGKCKQLLAYNFNYNEYIQVFDKMQIGNLEGKNLNIDNLTAEDLKMENLKTKAINFLEYLKGDNNKQG